MENTFKKKILCIGAGYIGGPTMGTIALKCPEYKVTVVDINKARIDAWNSDELPIYEPGLDEMIKSVRGTNLFFSTEVDAGIEEADIIFVCVNTPTKTFGEGTGHASDLQYWEKTARNILKVSKSSKIIVEKSTVPVKTAEAMERILKSNENGISFEVLSNPEFLAEGTAVEDMANPDRVLIGSRQTEKGLAACAELVEVYSHWVPNEKIITTNVWSAELSKLVANAFLAQRISSINSISALCEATGASVKEVSNAIGKDQRIGPNFLRSSIGFGGSCFKKDILNLVYLCRHYGLEEVADYWNFVVQMNDYQQGRFVKRMLSSMFNTLVGKKIAVFGFAFKADTGDTRESPAIVVSRLLLEEKATLSITDPKALANAKLDMQGVEGQFEFIDDPYQAAADADAVVVMTEWKEYAQLDFEKIYKSMRKPAFIFDGRNILDREKMHAIGFNFYSIGQADLVHF